MDRFPLASVMRAPLVLLLCLAGLTSAAAAAGKRAPVPLADTPFLQEVHRPLPLGAEAANDVRKIAVSDDGVVWAGTAAGLLALDRSTERWVEIPGGPRATPVTALAVEGKRVYVGSGLGLHRGTRSGLELVPEVRGPVSALAICPAGVLVAGPDGLWEVSREGRVVERALRTSRRISALLAVSPQEYWVATGLGLFHVKGEQVVTHQGPMAETSSNVRALAGGLDGRLWAGGLGGVAEYRQGVFRSFLDADAGLPDAWVQALAVDGTGSLWIGTRGGLARYDGRAWNWRHSRRWLLADDVRDIALEPGAGPGTTAWLATAGGVSLHTNRVQTLSAKAAYFHEVLRARHVREPGIVEKCRFRVPGDRATWEPEDDDNDGGYTALYLAMESFRFAATRDPEARERARHAFAALEFLQRVTETPGFIARTVIPADWTRRHDPNETLSAAEQALRRVEDPREKYVPVRWRTSRDGRWLWKGDTSSDEITAHLFGYYWFHELAADAEDRRRVREQVCRIVDHLIEHGYQLVDLDGRPTRWGVWAPERLNGDPDWANEAGINAVEILSYLQLAAHVSGETRYRDCARELLDRHQYRALVRRAKALNPASRTHIDDELLAFAWPPLVLLETDPGLKALYRRAFEDWHAAVAPDASPFFEILYAGLRGGGRPGRSAPLFGIIQQLREQPLDLVRWTVDNTRRDDVRLVRRPELEFVQTERLLPPAERGVPRTDENPRVAVQGDGGNTESDGVFWLLPYWMGRHFGYIAGPVDR